MIDCAVRETLGTSFFLDEVRLAPFPCLFAVAPKCYLQHLVGVLLIFILMTEVARLLLRYDVRLFLPEICHVDPFGLIWPYGREAASHITDFLQDFQSCRIFL